MVKYADKDECNYDCTSCGHNFNQKIGKFEGFGSGNHNCVSSQVKCSKCGSFMKTW